MGIMSWLRRIVADFLCTDGDESEREAGEEERELGAEKAVAALAVAQAHRSHLELQAAMQSGAADPAQLGRLVGKLEEDRERARQLVVSYRESQRRMVENLRRRGEMRVAAELSRERQELRDFVARTEAAADEAELEPLEAEIRAEAARLDVLTALERGSTGAEFAEKPPGRTEDVQERARALLAEDIHTHLWPGH
jgi:hypothetical protein